MNLKNKLAEGIEPTTRCLQILRRASAKKYHDCIRLLNQRLTRHFPRKMGLISSGADEFVPSFFPICANVFFTSLRRSSLVFLTEHHSV